MNLVYIAAIIAVCSADKLDLTYLPPPSANTAGGISGDIQTPFLRDSFNTGRSGLPNGAFDNDFDGVVVDAAPGTRATSAGDTGLGASRVTYGSTHSKVGEAAFKTINQQRFQTPSNGPNTQSSHDDQVEVQTFQNSQQGPHSDFNRASLRPQSALDRASNIVRYRNEIGPETYNYGFETDNGITVEENGVTVNGVQAEGRFSYTGDDGKVYKVTYTADEGGYKPIGDHLPTPPPIPDEILKSLEQNAKDEAAGLTDDGSYDAAKYNTGDDYTKSDSSDTKYNGVQSSFGKKPVMNDAAVGTFINQNNQAFGSLNVNEQITSSTHLTSKDIMMGNNVFGSLQNDDRSTQTATRFGSGNQQSYVGGNLETHGVQGENIIGVSHVSNSEQQYTEIPMFDPISQQNEPIKSQSSFTQFGIPELNNKANSYMNSQVDEFSSDDDYSRPIHFGPAQLNHESNDEFGKKKSYLPPIKNVAYKQREDSAQNHRPNLSNTHRKSENEFQTNFFTDRNLPQQLVGLQSISQTSPINNLHQYSQRFKNVVPSQNHNQFTKNFPNNLNLNTNSDGQNQKPTNFYPNTFNNLFSTLQPQTELTTPFEDLPISNNGNTLQSQENYDIKQNNQMIPPTPTQASFSTLLTPDYQAYNVKKTIFVHGAPTIGSNNNDNTSLNPNVALQSQYQAQDNSYYYNQPSKSFNTPIQNNRVTSSTLISENGNVIDNIRNSNKYQNNYFQGSTQYSTTPTKTPDISTILPKNMLHQYPNTFLDTSFASQTVKFGASTKYPTPTTITHVAPFPTTSVIKNDGKFPSQYTGITQASISPFPAISQPTENLGSFNKKDQTNAQLPNQDLIQPPDTSQVMSGFNRIGSQPKPSQQYDGEIYEYKKPIETLPSPKTEEYSQQKPVISKTGDFVEFGQKLRPSLFTQTPLSLDAQNINHYEHKTGSEAISQGSQLETNPQFNSPNLQSQFSKNKLTQESQSSDILNQRQSKQRPSDNLQTIDRIQSTQSTPITPGASPESQSQANNTPFGFSGRIRTCCQGSRISSLPGHDARKDFQRPMQHSIQTQSESNTGNFAQIRPQNANIKPEPEPQATPTASQSLQTGGVGEDFGGSRRPPSFDEASGYHY